MKYFTKITTEVKQEGIIKNRPAPGGFPLEIATFDEPPSHGKSSKKVLNYSSYLQDALFAILYKLQKSQIFPRSFYCLLRKVYWQGGAVFNSDF